MPRSSARASITGAQRTPTSANFSKKEHDLDAVVVCTTDNLHAAVSAAAMKKRKHVFCQKPLTHTIYEARRMAEIARETGVATQIAVANQASEATRAALRMDLGRRDRSGAPGHQLVEPPFLAARHWSVRRSSEPVPEGLDWDLWLGPAPERPFNHAYLAVCLAGLGRLRLRRTRRHGLL